MLRLRPLPLALLPLLATASAPAQAAPDARCTFDPAPAPPAAPATPLAAPPCHRPPQAVAATIRSTLAKRYQPQHPGGKVKITLNCDGLGPNIREIVLETGSGHGGSLGLWRATRAAGGRYDVRGIAYRGSSMLRAAKPIPFEIAAGTVDLPGLEQARGALAATVAEVVPPPPAGGGLGLSGFGSSRDFHVLVRLTDDDGRVLERRYTGYEGSSSQDQYLGLELAADALGRISGVPASAAAPTADDQRFFAERFAAAVPHFNDDFNWWVMERQVDLARFLGTPAVIPGLLTRLTVDKPDRSKIDARDGALDALARITGWDARPGVSAEEAAARYLKTCKPR